MNGLRRRCLAAGLCVLGMVGSAALGAPRWQEAPTQPGDGPAAPAPQAPGPRDRGGDARQKVRQAARARLDDLEGQKRRIEELLRRLDEGGDVAEIRGELDRTTGRGGGAGPRSPRSDRFENRRPPVEGELVPRAVPAEGRTEMTPEERQRALLFLDQHAERIATRLRELDKTKPEMVTRLLARMRPKLKEIMESPKNDPGSFELRLAEFRASLDVMWARRALDEAVASGDQDRIGARRGELGAAVGAHFDAQLALQEHDAQRLSERMEKLRSDIVERRAGRDKVIEREVEGAMRPGSRGPRSPSLTGEPGARERPPH